ncbi:MAG: glycosyltransferase [Oscillospiraceae bacterium]|nr:glycosyltransferase [Oscillospiraceae bacterium]
MKLHKYTFTVVIPAHNEEKYVERCIRSVKAAAEYYGGSVQIIVVCNRCTDRTAEIAKKHGADVIMNEDRCIAKVRNAGIFASKGEVIVTIDCDNRMTRGTLKEIACLLSTGKYIGGGAPIRFERYSFPLYCNEFLCELAFGITGLYCGIFWAERSTFQAVGGFTEKKAMEDAATAKALKAYGKSQGKKYTVLRKNVLINSTRKYDDMGDWLYLKMLFQNAGAFIKAAVGDKRELDKLFDKLFYDYNG